MTQYRPITIDGMTDPIGIAVQPSPMLQWIDIADMVVDDRYQRPINSGGYRTVRSIAENFRWSCFTPVLLAPIEGGRFAVIDGQHRVHAALLCGIKAVPAMVVPIAATEQATAFIQVNTARTAMSNYNLFKAGLAAGVPWALTAEKAVSDAGCTLMTFNPASNARKSGQICSVGLIRDMVLKGHARAVTIALTAIRAIDNGAASAILLYSDWTLNPLIKAVAQFPKLDADTLADLLRKRRPFNVIDAAEKVAKEEGRPKAIAAREAFITLIRQQIGGAK
jgi:hypothetical protein